MTATYTLPAEEITMDIIQSIKETFKGKKVNVTFTESVGEEMDETEYLLSNPNNKKFLDESFAELEAGKGIRFTIEELKQRFGVE